MTINEDLLIACENQQIDVIRLLISRGADVNAKDVEGVSAIQKAAERGYLDVIQLLVQNNALLDQRRLVEVEYGSVDSGMVGYIPCNRTELMLAAEKGFTDIVRYLFDNGSDIKAVTYDKRYGNGLCAFHYAAIEGHIEALKLLHTKKFPVDYKDSLGRTALYLACWRGHIPVVKFLIENGAQLTSKSEWKLFNLFDFYSAQYAAVLGGQPDVLKYLISIGASIDPKLAGKNLFAVANELLTKCSHEEKPRYERVLNVLINEQNDQTNIALLMGFNDKKNLLSSKRFSLFGRKSNSSGLEEFHNNPLRDINVFRVIMQFTEVETIEEKKSNPSRRA